ncbi:MAG: hypothetical protein WCO55_00815 [Candidatus Falkowbacteria bacterium]
MNYRGFTFFEILLVFAITAVMAILTIPGAVNYFSRQSLDETTSQLSVDLRRVRDQAMAGKNDASWGIRQFGNYYVLFEGSTFATRDTTEDLTVNLDNGVTLSGPSELVFYKLTGTSTASSTFNLANSVVNYNVYVDSNGKIEK